MLSVSDAQALVLAQVGPLPARNVPLAADALGLGYLFVVTVGIGQLPGLLEQARTRTHPAYVSEP